MKNQWIVAVMSFAFAHCMGISSFVQAQSWLGFNAAVPKVSPGYGTSGVVATPGTYGAPGVTVQRLVHSLLRRLCRL